MCVPAKARSAAAADPLAGQVATFNGTCSEERGIQLLLLLMLRLHFPSVLVMALVK